MSLGIDPESLIQSGFEGHILRPGDQAYEDANKRWCKLIERNAGLVVQPRNSNDVAKAIRFAVCHKYPVVIKGGGHGGFASSSTEGGVVIDLAAHLHSIEIDEEAGTMTVGGGTPWSDIDRETYKHGLAIVGPMHSDVSVGGFVLGGGYGGLTGKMGLGCDQLIRATLVTADGSVVDVNEDREPELLWGLGGAGCNFGPVTSLTLRLHPEPKHIFGATSDKTRSCPRTLWDWCSHRGRWGRRSFSAWLIMHQTSRAPRGTSSLSSIWDISWTTRS